MILGPKDYETKTYHFFITQRKEEKTVVKIKGNLFFQSKKMVTMSLQTKLYYFMSYQTNFFQNGSNALKIVIFLKRYILSSTRGIDRSHFTSYSGSIDPDHYSEQKKREIYTDRPGPFHSIGEGRFTQIDRSVRIDRSIPCRGKNPKSIFLVLYDYIRIDSHLI